MLAASIAGRSVTIVSEEEQQPLSTFPLSKASWLVLGCTDFETEDLARQFGEGLRRAAHLAGLCSRVGVDAGDPGEDRTRSWFNPELILPVLQRDNPDMRLGPDVHGIVILPDDGSTVFMRGRVDLALRSNADHFLRTLEDALPNDGAPQSGSPSIRRAIRMLNLAEMNQDPIAKVVLAISTVEGLATDLPWTDGQRKLIENSAAWLETTQGKENDVSEVVEAIRRLRKESIRQRLKKLLTRTNLSHLWNDWDGLYSKRSRLFHSKTEAESENRADYLEDSELQGLGQEAILLSARVVLTMAKKEGIRVPCRAKVHFGIE